jgi:hypothetical protein
VLGCKRAPFNPNSSASENKIIISFYVLFLYKKARTLSKIVATPEPASLAGVGMGCHRNEKEVVGLSNYLVPSILAKIFRDLTKFPIRLSIALYGSFLTL